MTALEPTNSPFTEWARIALAVFTSHAGVHPDNMRPDDLESAIGDLICALLHLAARKSMDARVDIYAHALEHVRERSWPKRNAPTAQL